MAAGHQFADGLREGEPTSVSVLQHPPDLQRHIQAQHVGQGKGPHGRQAPALYYGVDLLAGGPRLLLQTQHLHHGHHEHPVDKEAGALLNADRDLAQRLGESHGVLQRLFGGLLSGDHLDELHHAGWIEEVEAEHALGPACRRRHLADGQGGGVGSQDGQGRCDPVQLGEHAALQVEILWDRFDHEVHVAEGVIGEGGHDQVQLAGHLRFGHPSPVYPALVDAPGPGDASVQGLLVYVLQHHW